MHISVAYCTLPIPTLKATGFQIGLWETGNLVLIFLFFFIGYSIAAGERKTYW